jgi:lysophospholipid acyltransferase (LPLAT)-like uncharacterized protein
VTALAPRLAAGLVRLLGPTLRLQIIGVAPLLPFWAAGRPVIYAVWHGRILMLPWLNARLRRRHGARAPRVLASRSRDGELMARFAAAFGLEAVRGSSSQGGALALLALAAAVRRGEDVAVVPDGPRGPAGDLQAGVVTLATMTAAPVVPLAFAARPARRLGSWDRFVVPLPFARCAAVFGAAVALEAGADRDRARKTLQTALDEATAEADRLVAVAARR